MNHVLEVKDIRAAYRGRNAVDALNFAVAEGALVCLLGPSGCGKTTALRAIAGFQELLHGEIRIGGQPVSRPGYQLPPEKRKVGMVFQEHALFPHLNVAANVAAGLRDVDRRQREQTVQMLLERMGIAHMGQRYPHELSGGQQQRVALARALAPSPSLLLMDEPFSNLDLELRERLGVEVADILKEHGITCVMVTHDQHDAFALGEQVGVMHEGRILQWDTPYNLYHEPNCRFIADFVGDGVFVPGTVRAPEVVDTVLGPIQGNRAYPWSPGTPVEVLIRPDDVVPSPDSATRARVKRKAFKGAEILYTLALPNDTTLLSLFPSHSDHAVGDDVGIELKVDHLVAFANEGDASETTTV